MLLNIILIVMSVVGYLSIGLWLANYRMDNPSRSDKFWVTILWLPFMLIIIVDRTFFRMG